MHSILFCCYIYLNFLRQSFPTEYLDCFQFLYSYNKYPSNSWSLSGIAQGIYMSKTDGTSALGIYTAEDEGRWVNKGTHWVRKGTLPVNRFTIRLERKEARKKWQSFGWWEEHRLLYTAGQGRLLRRSSWIWENVPEGYWKNILGRWQN